MPKIERTGDQVLVTTGVDGELQKSQSWDWGKKVREMRKDATLGFVRDLYMAPILTAAWTVTSVDDAKYKDAVDFVVDQFVNSKWRRLVLRNVVRGLLDFGWQGFELVLDAASGQVKVHKIKPLLQDITSILVEENGDFYGLRNRPTFLNGVGALKTGPWTDLLKSECLLFNRDVEGTNWYGEALMVRARSSYESWQDCEKAAKRFDAKIAGAHWVVHYPVGHTPYKGVDEVDNYVIATDILAAMESSGKFAIPRVLAQAMDDLNSLSEDRLAWKIEILAAPTTSASSFVDRQKYLDALKARAIGIPERAVFEGQFGTKAEAESHADFAITNIEMGHQDIVEQLNEQAVDPLLAANFGEDAKGKVKVVAAALSDENRAMIRDMYMKRFDDETLRAEEEETVDWAAVREELEVPVVKDSNRKPTNDGSRNNLGRVHPGGAS